MSRKHQRTTSPPASQHAYPHSSHRHAFKPWSSSSSSSHSHSTHPPRRRSPSPPHRSSPHEHSSEPRPHHPDHRSAEGSRQHDDDDDDDNDNDNDNDNEGQGVRQVDGANVGRTSAETALKRDDWMLEHTTQASKASTGIDATQGHDQGSYEDDAPSQGDFFSSIGTSQRIKRPKEAKADPDQLKVSSREVNTQFAQGKHLDEYAQQPKANVTFGAPGHQWRMMKLRKTYEQAREEGRSIDDLAMERYGDMASFQQAKAEREYLERSAGDDSPRGQRYGRNNPARPSPAALTTGSSRSFMFTDSPSSSFGAGSSSRPVSRQSFRKPGESSTPSTPQPEATVVPSHGARLGSLRAQSGTPQQSKASTPVPSVFTPIVSSLGRAAAAATSTEPNFAQSDPASTGSSPQPSHAVQSAVAASQARDIVSNPPLDAAALNKLEAKVMKAEMTGKSNAQSLRQKLEREKARATCGGDQGGGHFQQEISVHPVGTAGEMTEIQVLPTLDGRGRLYDIGRGRPGEDLDLPPGNRRRKANKVQTHDPATGELVRYNVDDDEMTLEEMVRQEKFKAGSRDQKNYDAELSSRIASDGGFREGFDYLDENVERLARKKMKTDSLKRQFAINDFAKTKKALESCRFCFQDEGERPPLARTVASGTRAYLALTENEPLVEGHCLIVPIQHHLSMLDADDDTWEEVKNFMKCLLQLAAKKAQSFVFFETVLSLSHQRHTVIECLPLSSPLLSILPSTFRQELLTIESDWSQHPKLIEFSTERPFRRSMVSQLPYFMIQFDHKGQRGYGHIIEEVEVARPSQRRQGRYQAQAQAQDQDQEDGYAMTERSMGGGTFPAYFATEIIGSLLELEPRAWRKPNRLDHRRGGELLARCKKEWDPVDWTKMLSAPSTQGEERK